VKAAYGNAKPIYRHLFERKSLDWIIDRKDEAFGRSLLHAMWILARWNFKTVRGDILSGVYDKYLEPTQRKRLGEIYTRPELARYVIERCNWTDKKSLLDPACGSGTFLVEAFDLAQQRSEQKGLGFDVDDAIALLGKLNGLDINEFSATLAKIQLLWHVLASTQDDPSRIRAAIRLLKIEGGHSSLDTWGLPMARNATYGLEFPETTGGDRRALKVADRRFRDISTAEQQFDVVVGNPPYVRMHRVKMSKEIRKSYSEVDHKSTDLSVYFAYRAIQWWLKDGGRMAFFLPFALSESAYADNLRRILERYKLIELVDLELLGNTVFHGANIVAMIVIIEKTPASPGDLVQITTLDESSFDAESASIDITRATVTTQPRGDITLSKYLPAAAAHATRGGFGEEEEEEEEKDEEGDEEGNALGTEWLLKVKAADVQALSAIAASPRLESMMLYGYEKRKKHVTERALSVPSGEDAAKWKRKAIAGYGVKIGGVAPMIENGLPIYKGADVFPDGISGDEMGRWDGSPETVDTIRFYGWDKLVGKARDNCYAFRQISLSLTATQHPDDCYLQNTTYLIQLADAFPLNIYVLSRIPSWFMLKTARTSVVSGSMRTTWYRRNLLMIPVPEIRGEAFINSLIAIGQRMFAFDAETVRARNLLDAFIDPNAELCDPLRVRSDIFDDSRMASLAKVSWPEKGMEWTDAVAVETEQGIEFRTPVALFPSLIAPTASGEPCRIEVSDPKLRRWLCWLANEQLGDGELPSLRWLKNVPIPKNLDNALETLDRLESGQALVDLQSALDDLDFAVAQALGLSETQMQYIIHEMKTDPLLSRLNPAWRHTAGRKKIFTAYGSKRSY
jgi:hypothetical protein